ncbi:hypothetical protein Hanom_Chr13g01241731 [Helianthus anomalus]
MSSILSNIQINTKVSSCSIRNHLETTFYKSELEVLSFIYILFRRCPLFLIFTSFVLIVSKSCTIRPLALTQLDFSVKSDHVPCT